VTLFVAKSNNQPDSTKHFRVIALDLSKIVKINLVRSVTWCIKLSDNGFWHNLSATFNNQPDLLKHFGVMALI